MGGGCNYGVLYSCSAFKMVSMAVPNYADMHLFGSFIIGVEISLA